MRRRLPGRVHRPGPDAPGRRSRPAGQAAAAATGGGMTPRRDWRIAILLPLLLSLLAPALAVAPAKRPIVAPHPPGAAIASGHALATEAGLTILNEGGNAFDAAVAVSATL